MIKKILISVFVLQMVLGLNVVYAKEALVESYKIPDTYTSGRCIEFLDDHHFKDVEIHFDSDNYEEITETESVSTRGKIIVETYPDPVKGLFIEYGNDGEVNRIFKRKGDDVKAFYKVSTKNQSVYGLDGVDDPHYRLKAQWGGDKPQYLYEGISNYGKYKYYGRGRATNFTGKIGQGNHILKKGDVATKLKYDNVKLGTKVNVTMANKSGVMKSVIMYKYSAGGMPQAIVDIWNTGVEYWGYKYSGSWSVNNVTIEHN